MLEKIRVEKLILGFAFFCARNSIKIEHNFQAILLKILLSLINIVQIQPSSAYTPPLAIESDPNGTFKLRETDGNKYLNAYSNHYLVADEEQSRASSFRFVPDQNNLKYSRHSASSSRERRSKSMDTTVKLINMQTKNTFY